MINLAHESADMLVIDGPKPTAIDPRLLNRPVGEVICYVIL